MAMIQFLKSFTPIVTAIVSYFLLVRRAGSRPACIRPAALEYLESPLRRLSRPPTHSSPFPPSLPSPPFPPFLHRISSLLLLLPPFFAPHPQSGRSRGAPRPVQPTGRREREGGREGERERGREGEVERAAVSPSPSCSRSARAHRAGPGRSAPLDGAGVPPARRRPCLPPSADRARTGPPAQPGPRAVTATASYVTATRLTAFSGCAEREREGGRERHIESERPSFSGCAERKREREREGERERGRKRERHSSPCSLRVRRAGSRPAPAAGGGRGARPPAPILRRVGGGWRRPAYLSLSDRHPRLISAVGGHVMRVSIT